jgi:hypothetical protein
MITKEDVIGEYSCKLLSGGGGLMDLIAIGTTGGVHVDVEFGNDYGIPGCFSSYGGKYDIREADAQVCVSQIEAKCAELGTPIQL